MLGPSLPGNHGMLKVSWGLLGRFCPGLCVQISLFFSEDLNYCPSFVVCTCSMQVCTYDVVHRSKPVVEQILTELLWVNEPQLLG